MIEEEKVRWKECPECDGQGYCRTILKMTFNPGMGPTSYPEEVNIPCECREGYVKIWAGDTGYEEALPIHPDDE